ncbi:hypothetical protein ABZT11_39020 [Streptomyces avermitilis]
MGWTVQVPMRRAAERDEDAVATPQGSVYQLQLNLDMAAAWQRRSGRSRSCRRPPLRHAATGRSDGGVRVDAQGSHGSSSVGGLVTQSRSAQVCSLIALAAHLGC